MKNLLIKFCLVCFLFISLQGLAFAKQSETQEVEQTEKVEMADALRANGKIYVVVAVVVVILSGLVIYTVNIDRKINKIEKELGIE